LAPAQPGRAGGVQFSRCLSGGNGEIPTVAAADAAVPEAADRTSQPAKSKISHEHVVSALTNLLALKTSAGASTDSPTAAPVASDFRASSRYTKADFLKGVAQFYAMSDPVRDAETGKIVLGQRGKEALKQRLEAVSALSVGGTTPELAAASNDLASLFNLADQLTDEDTVLRDEDLALLAALVDDVAGFQLEEAPPRWAAPYSTFSQPPATQSKAFVSGLVDGMDASTVQAVLKAYGEVADVRILSSADKLALSREGYSVPDSDGVVASVTFENEADMSKLCAIASVVVEASVCSVAAAVSEHSGGVRAWSRLKLAADDEAKAKALWATLPPKLQLYFTSPLGEFDAVGFMFAVCRMSPASKEFLAHVSDPEYACEDPAEADRLYSALNPLLQHLGQHLWPTGSERAMPAHVMSAAAQIQNYQAALDQVYTYHKLTRIMSRYDLAERWQLTRPPIAHKAFNYGEFWKQLEFLASVPRHADGTIESDEGLAQIEALRNSLPEDLRRDLAEETTAKFADVLLALYTRAQQPTVESEFADEQYDLWQEIYGNAPVPADRALALFTNGDELITLAELKSEDRYRHPTYLKPPPPARRNKSRARNTGESREDDVGDEMEFLPYANVSLGNDNDGGAQDRKNAADGKEKAKRALETGELDLFGITEAALAANKRVFHEKTELAVQTTAPTAMDDVPDTSFSSFFTSRMHFYSLWNRLQILESIASNASVSDTDKMQTQNITPSFRRREDFYEIIGDDLTIFEYRTIVQQLNKLWQHPNFSAINDEVQPYLRPSVIDAFGSASQTKQRDADRATASGRRKSSSAKVYLSTRRSAANLLNEKYFGIAAPSADLSGTISVNGQPLADYFSRGQDRLEVLRPLVLTGHLSTYDIACDVKGGGNTGQAGAVQLAISRALLTLDPETKAVMRPAKLLTRDARRVERKKPGQKKARKKFQWVKR